MSKILITGGAGFVGYHLANKLSENPADEICIADNLVRGRMDKEFEELLRKPNLRIFSIDLTNLNSVKEIWNYYNEVYHLAAVVGVKHCMRDPARVLEINLKSTMNITQLMIENGCKKIVFSSTCETYAGGFELGIVKVPTDERVPVSVSDIRNPRFSYAVSKIAGEQLVIFNAKDNYDYTIVRYHNIFGPRMGYSHVIPEILKRVYQKENPFKIYGYDQTRAFCYVDDGVEQTIACMRNSSTDGEIVHVGNDQEEILIKVLVKKIFDLLDYKPEVLEVPAPPGSVKRRCPDISKVKRLTGVKPEVCLDEALKKTVDWYWEEIKKGNIWE